MTGFRVLPLPPDCYLSDLAAQEPAESRMQRYRHARRHLAGLDALCVLDPRLAEVRATAGEVPLRLSEPGFRSLASIIVSQQVSRASADAIFGRLVKLVDPLTPEALLAAGEGLFREAGLSRPKQRAADRRGPGSASMASISTTSACSMPRTRSANDRGFRHRAVDGGSLSSVRRRPPRHLPGTRRRPADSGRPRARHRPASGREGADQNRRIMVARGGVSHRGFSGRIIAK